MVPAVTRRICEKGGMEIATEFAEAFKGHGRDDLASMATAALAK